MRMSTSLGALLLAGCLAGCGGHGSATKAGGSQDASAPPAQAAAGAVAPRDPQNLLIGVWHLSGETDDPAIPGATCQTTDFTATAAQITQVTNGASDTIPVRYVPSASEVYVVTDAGITNATKYIVLDADDVKLDAILDCTYHRVG